jgi:hypothetical protein
MLNATLTRSSVKSNDLAPDCLTLPLQCGQVCVLVHGDPTCAAGDPFNLTGKFVWNSLILEDTAGLIMPLTIAQNIPPFQVNQIKGLAYLGQINVTFGCPYIQFSFFNDKNQTAGWTYITPGQIDNPCVSFFNSTVTGYSGVTMLTDFPEELLDWANTIGNEEEE